MKIIFSTMIAVLLAGAAESQADHNVTISGSGSSNGSCSGGPPDVRDSERDRLGCGGG